MVVVMGGGEVTSRDAVITCREGWRGQEEGKRQRSWAAGLWGGVQGVSVCSCVVVVVVVSGFCDHDVSLLSVFPARWTCSLVLSGESLCTSH